MKDPEPNSKAPSLLCTTVPFWRELGVSFSLPVCSKGASCSISNFPIDVLQVVLFGIPNDPTSGSSNILWELLFWGWFHLRLLVATGPQRFWMALCNCFLMHVQEDRVPRPPQRAALMGDMLIVTTACNFHSVEESPETACTIFQESESCSWSSQHMGEHTPHTGVSRVHQSGSLYLSPAWVGNKFLVLGNANSVIKE